MPKENPAIDLLMPKIKAHAPTMKQRSDVSKNFESLAAQACPECHKNPQVRFTPPDLVKVEGLERVVASSVISPAMYPMVLDVVEGHNELVPCPCNLKEQIKPQPLIFMDVPRDYMEPPPTFDSFRVEKSNEKAFEACRGWVTAYDAGKDYPAPMLIGPVGTGKTRLLWTILTEIVGRRNGSNEMIYHREVEKANRQEEPDRDLPYRKFRYKYVTVPHFSEKVRLFWKNHRDVVDYRKEMLAADILVLDDIGAENMTEMVREQFHLLVEERVVSRKPLLVACNFNREELEQWTGSRILSRLQGACDIIEVHGTDKRAEEKERRLRQT
jgi:DNA replication protein DnaC